MSFKKIWNTVSTVLVALVVLIAVGLVGARVAGMRAYSVLSGSMEPTYHVGSLIFVKEIAPEAVAVGDPITFMASESAIVTHRVTEILPDEDDPSVLRFRTKGDANDVEDGSLVHENNLVGKPVCSVPLVGFVANAIQHPPGNYIAIVLAALIVLVAFWPDDDKKKASPGNSPSTPADSMPDDEDKK